MRCIEEVGDTMTELGHTFRRVWEAEDRNDIVQRIVEEFTVTQINPVVFECRRLVTPRGYVNQIEATINFAEPDK